MLRTLGRIIEYTVLAGIIFVALLVLSSVIPVPGGTKTYVVRSGSMEPAIKTGAVVVVLPRDAYNVGDVITFGQGRTGETPTTHRIVSVSGSGENATYMTKGDANEEPDGQPIVARNVVGKVLFDIPYLGYAVAAAQKPAGFVALVILPALIVIVDQIQTLIRELRKGRNEGEQDASQEDISLPPGNEPQAQRQAGQRMRLRRPRTIVRISGPDKTTKAENRDGKKLLMSNQ